MDEPNILITGANGQLGRALQEAYPNAKKTDSSELDISDQQALQDFDWKNIQVIINTAAYTNVPEAENQEGRLSAWKINATSVGYLADIANEHDLTLVHISTAYVFNGQQDMHTEDEPVSPLSSYGSSKAAGDIAASRAKKHYIIRTSAVAGDGGNFIRSIIGLGKKGISPKVVSDETDRPTFTTELARGIKYLLANELPGGIYNITNDGDVVTWADLARAIYKEAGFDNLEVFDSTAAEYFAGKAIADKRPTHGALNLSKIKNTGFSPRDWRDDLREYVKKETEK
jgi:dTDP-4-dehydrorhamnose reductase